MDEGMNQKNQKHIELWDAVKSIQRIEDKFNDFLKKVKNDPENENKTITDEKIAEKISLMHVLIDSPKKINCSCERILKMLEELDNILF